MNWGKSLALLAVTALIAGCAGQSADKPSASSTPLPSPSLTIKSQTGDAAADKLIAIIQASCNQAKASGLEGYVVKKKATIYAFPAYFKTPGWDWNMLTKTAKGYEIGGWVSGDPICNEALYASWVVANDAPKNENGIRLGYVLKKISADTFDWSVHRGSPDMSPTRIVIKNNLITAMTQSNDYGYEFKYGPFTSAVTAAYKKALVASNQQYLPVAEAVWNMTYADARVYLKKHGLKIMLGFKDDVALYPSGPPAGISDPKRIIVNLIDGKIVGLWTM